MSKTPAFDEESFENDLAEFAIEMETSAESSVNHSSEIQTAENNCSAPGVVHAAEEDMGSCDVTNSGQDLVTHCLQYVTTKKLLR